MTKNKLLIAIENYNRGIIHFGTVESAVDRYSSALLQQTQCTALLPSDDELFTIVEKILFEQSSADPMTECVNKMNLLRQFINDKCLSAIA